MEDAQGSGAALGPPVAGPRGRGRVWRNWAGTVTARPRERPAPASLEALQALVRGASAAGRTLRVVGSGHSFTPLVASDDVLVSLDALSGLTHVDAGALRAEAWGGTKLHALGRALATHGLAMENLGDINVQSLAGAVSTGTHGTGSRFGSISTQVEGLTLVLASGEVVECSPTREAELFSAARVSLGALGVIARLKLRLLPSYRLKLSRRTVPLEECLATLAEADRAHRNFEFYWFPYSDVALTKASDTTDEAPSHRGAGAFLNDVLLENGAFWLMCQAGRAVPPLIPRIARLCAGVASEGAAVDASERIYATPRLVRFKEMEYAVPAGAGADCIREIRALVERERIRVNFPLEFRFVKGDDIPLSPFHGRDSALIAVHMLRGMPHERYFAAVEAIFRNHRGRPHWGKMHTRTAAELAALYPGWDAFHALRRRLDPRGTFLNPYLRRLFGEEG
jgi:FAD-linked oxidoreductase